MFSSTTDPELQPFIHSINIIVPATGSWISISPSLPQKLEGGRERLPRHWALLSWDINKRLINQVFQMGSLLLMINWPKIRWQLFDIICVGKQKYRNTDVIHMGLRCGLEQPLCLWTLTHHFITSPALMSIWDPICPLFNIVWWASTISSTNTPM